MRKFLVLLGVVLLIGLGIPVLAISNPSSVGILDTFVFRNVLESGDQLYFVRYDVNYSTNPTELASDTFLVAIYDGSTPLYTRPLNYYQHNIISIYLTPAQALTWAEPYEVRVTGSPSLFSPLIENTNVKTITLAVGNYYEASSLGSIMLTQAQTLEDEWGIDLLTTEGLLNTTGSFYFRRAVTRLETMEPDIFSSMVSSYVVTRTDWAEAYRSGLSGNAGTRLSDATEDIGDWLGMSSGWVSFLLVGVGFLMLAGVVYSSTGNPGVAMIVSFPLVIGAAYVFGGSIFQLALMAVFVLGVLFAIYFILMRFA